MTKPELVALQSLPATAKRKALDRGAVFTADSEQEARDLKQAGRASDAPVKSVSASKPKA